MWIFKCHTRSQHPRGRGLSSPSSDCLCDGGGREILYVYTCTVVSHGRLPAQMCTQTPFRPPPPRFSYPSELVSLSGLGARTCQTFNKFPLRNSFFANIRRDDLAPAWWKPYTSRGYQRNNVSAGIFILSPDRGKDHAYTVKPCITLLRTWGALCNTHETCDLSGSFVSRKIQCIYTGFFF